MARISARDVREAPVYTAMEAARYLHLPPSTVRAWAFGQRYGKANAAGAFQPVIKPADREEKTKGGIYLPDTASKERPMEGTVLAVGEGRLDDNGRRVPMNVKAGDKVLFAKYSGTEYKVDDVEYLILSEKDILGVIQE